tara:strand:- start:2110 stop:3870 length:1761 start_codon:yes stop_codon:yes gene_type:complete
MAYNSIATPRFYIDYFSYWLSKGLISDVKPYQAEITGFPIGLDPSSPFTLNVVDNQYKTTNFSIDFNEILNSDQLDQVNYVAVLGHTLNQFKITSGVSHILNTDNISVGVRMSLYKKYHQDAGVGSHSWRGTASFKSWDEQILNVTHENSESWARLPKEGASIFGTKLRDQNNTSTKYINPTTGDYISSDDIESGEYTGEWEVWSPDIHGANVDRIAFTIKPFAMIDGAEADVDGSTDPFYSNVVEINNVSMGHYYDLPFSPDLKLTMEVDFDGTDTITTSGGSTITNIRYSGNPKWGTLNPWEVGKADSVVTRGGRRSWKLSFRYVADNVLFASNYMTNTYIENNSGYKAEDLDTMNYGEMPILNKNLTDWSGGNPDNWRVFVEGEDDVTSNTKVVESSGKAHFTQEADDNLSGILVLQPKLPTSAIPDGFDQQYQIIEELENYRLTVDIDQITTGTCRIRIAGQTFDFTSGQAGIKVFEVEGTSASEIRITTTAKNVDADFKIDSIKLEKANPEDFMHKIANDDSFYGKVLNYIGNGERFIFQPDNTANNPSDFAICILDQDSIELTQVAYKTYNVRLKIKEVW